jgi:hypothetical protein
MTLTTPRATHSRTADIQWTAVQAGLWVGKSNGEFAGMIEAHWGEGFSATTRLGKHLGMFESVDAAKAKFAAE